MGVETTELCWLNGRIIPLADAKISIEDRGFQFADGVYEAVRIYRGKPFALQAHLDRLENSRNGLQLPMPIERQPLTNEVMEYLRGSGVQEGLLYFQLTRGVARRNHLFPKQPVAPTFLLYCWPLPPVTQPADQKGAKLLSVPDERWRKCWIKTIGLTANVLARNEAAAAGAEEAAFVDEHGIVAECTSSNLFFVMDGVLVTHPVGARVLPGITRDLVIDCARQSGIAVQERPVHVDEAKRAAEVFITSTTRQVIWVNRWDDPQVGGGRCGEITIKLAEALQRRIDVETAG